MSSCKKKNTSVARSRVQKMFSNSKTRHNNDQCFIKTSIYTDPEPKLLIVITKKVGNAPQRNYLRRCVKQLYTLCDISIFKRDVIIYFKPKTERCSFQQLKTLFENLAISLKKSL
jgi:ribonuclease P protein component